MDTNRLINIEDLQVGDEVLVARNSSFTHMKVLRKPQLSKTVYRWNPAKTRWKAVLCAAKRKQETTTWGVPPHQYSRTKIIYTVDGDFNCEVRANFNFNQLWLIKREGEYYGEK